MIVPWEMNQWVPVVPEFVVQALALFAGVCLVWAIIQLVLLIFEPIQTEMDEGTED